MKKKKTFGVGGSFCVLCCISSAGKGIKAFKITYGKKGFGVLTKNWTKQFHQVSYTCFNCFMLLEK